MELSGYLYFYGGRRRIVSWPEVSTKSISGIYCLLYAVYRFYRRRRKTLMDYPLIYELIDTGIEQELAFMFVTTRKIGD